MLGWHSQTTFALAAPDHAARQPTASTTPTHSRPPRDIDGKRTGSEPVERQRPDRLRALLQAEHPPRPRAVARVAERERERRGARVALPEDLLAAPRVVGEEGVGDHVPADQLLLAAAVDDAQGHAVEELRGHGVAVGLVQ